MHRSLSMMPWWMDNVLSQVTGLSGKINEYTLKRREVSFFLSLRPLGLWIAFHRPCWCCLSLPVNGCNVASYRERDTQMREGDVAWLRWLAVAVLAVVIFRAFLHECLSPLPSCVVAFKYASCTVGCTSNYWWTTIWKRQISMGVSKVGSFEILVIY